MRELPVGRRKRAHDVAEQLEAMIAADEFAVGSHLPSEKELMARFGVGRPAVREALFMLQQQGRIEIASGTRARVISPTPKFLVEQVGELIRRVTGGRLGQEYMEQARLLFETGLAWQAAQIATDEDVSSLKRALEANVAAVGKVGEFIRTDVAFHYELARIARNPVFNVVHEILVEWLVDQRTTTIHMPDADRLSVRDHTAIYEAVAAREPARAFHEMASHLRLISRLYSEAKRLSETILREVTRDVATRIEQENEALWATSFGSPRPSAVAAVAGIKSSRANARKQRGGS
ncbi:MAG TPA: FCD domain-containing protein [Geminicoccaceae bacterium]|nr:FCD domain-containing protein [Geminicoccaceae bacterium]